MRASSPSDDHDGSADPAAAADPAPAPINRAARRGKADKHDGTPAAGRGGGVRSRPAQGRRINPIRRTG